MNNKVAAMAGTGSQYSWGQLFNPVSQYFGGGDRYPEFVAKMFPDNARAAWLTSKVGAVGLLAAALAGVARLVQHGAKMRELADSDDPARNVRNDLGTTFNIPLDTAEQGKKGQRKKAAEVPLQTVPYPGALNVFKNTVNTAIPIGAFALAAALSYKGADYLADRRRNAVLDKAIANKRNTIRNLMKVRAQQARGVVDDAAVQRELDNAASGENYVKTASDAHPIVRNALSSLGLVVLGLGGAAALGAYRYFSMANPNNIKYNAINKGLREYARTKASGTPLTIVPTDSEQYFQQIAGGDDPKGQSPREQPELTETRKHISITL